MSGSGVIQASRNLRYWTVQGFTKRPITAVENPLGHRCTRGHPLCTLTDSPTLIQGHQYSDHSTPHRGTHTTSCGIITPSTAYGPNERTLLPEELPTRFEVTRSESLTINELWKLDGPHLEKTVLGHHISVVDATGPPCLVDYSLWSY